jgi:hypothetical protein
VLLLQLRLLMLLVFQQQLLLLLPLLPMLRYQAACFYQTPFAWHHRLARQ